ncbi:MAG: hypothetical protein ABIX37_04215 [Gammaproteobacteria bacterium]
MKTKGMGIALLSAAALLSGAAAQAGDLPWTYGEIGYSMADGVDNFETTAGDLKLSVGFAGMWHASLGYTDGTSEQGSVGDIDFDGYRLIVGAHPQLTPDTQLVGDLTYFDYNDDRGDVDGYGFGLGVRHGVTDNFELLGEVWYLMGNNDDDFFGGADYNDTTVELGGRYNWTSNLSTGLTATINGSPGASYSYSNGADAIRLDVRWSFPGDVSK